MRLYRKSIGQFLRDGMAKTRVLVVGDVMLDQYFYGEVTRISPEAPVPVTRVVRTKETLGGAANVVHNLALLGCHAELVGFIGRDFHAESLRAQMASRAIDASGLIETVAATTTKVRVIGGHQQMMRLDFEDSSPLTAADAAALRKRAAQAIADGAQAVILSDYGKGVCTAETCAAVLKAAEAHGVPVIVDPKGSDWGRYRGASYITPNLKELNEVQRTPAPNEDAAVTQAARGAMRRFGIRGMVATRSECGLSLVKPRVAVHIPTKAREVFDVSGAGDTVIAVFALALAGGLDPASSAYLANLAAGVVVGKLGTYAVSHDELSEAFYDARE